MTASINRGELALEACNWLKELIAIPSYSRDEAFAADYVERVIRAKGFNPSRTGNNVWVVASHFDEEKPTILLNSHIDTVKPVNGWSQDPHQPLCSDGRIVGLGSNDAGASVVSLLQTFFTLSEVERAYNLLFLASAEEEVSGANGVDLVLPMLPKIDLAIVGEPTGMNVAVAEKGLMVLDCHVKGEAGHAALASGVNAIYKAIDVVEQIRNFRFPKTSYLLGEVQMTVTMINAGTQHNVVPDLCSFVVDVRSNELYSNKDIADMLGQYLRCEIKPRSFRLNSSRIDTSHPIISRARTMGLELFGSPTLSDQALMPFPSIKMGPGSSARSHTADEYILEREIQQAIDTYLGLLERLKF